MFGKIILGILAIMFWPITLGVGAIILLWAVWVTFFTTKDHYRAPRNEETGEELQSFLMGGEGDEEDPPHDEHCINAWMFLLADAEDVSEDDVERREKLITRAINILNHAGVDESDADFDATTDSIVPDLIYHLRQNPDATWIEQKLTEQKKAIHFPFDQCLKAAKKSKGIPELEGDWRKLADEKLNQVKATIPDYSEDEISSLAKQFATFIRANEQSLTISFDTYETISFSKALCRFEWGGETVTESGLAHLAGTFNYTQDRIPSGSELQTHVWDEVYQEKSGFDYGFLFSSATSNHDGKAVPVVVDIDEAPEYYIWTVSEGSMDYDIYDEKKEGGSTPECTRIECSAGDLIAIFDIVNDSAFERFLNQLKTELEDLSAQADALNLT